MSEPQSETVQKPEEAEATPTTTIPGDPRFQVLSRIFNSVKEDKPVTLSPCGMKLVRCTNGGIEEIKGFEELPLRDKMYVAKTVLEIHEDIFNKHREIEMRKQAQAQSGQGPRGMQLVGASRPGIIP